MRPSFLDDDLRFVLFEGKGGARRTTSAVASALYLAEHNPNKKLLLVPTDPAHSLSDSPGQPIGDRIALVTGAANPLAREADAGRPPVEFKEIVSRRPLPDYRTTVLFSLHGDVLRRAGANN
jgi:anion-transporting  ArsA/GET3 family ATPase